MYALLIVNSAGHVRCWMTGTLARLNPLVHLLPANGWTFYEMKRLPD